MIWAGRAAKDEEYGQSYLLLCPHHLVALWFLLSTLLAPTAAQMPASDGADDSSDDTVLDGSFDEKIKKPM